MGYEFQSNFPAISYDTTMFQFAPTYNVGWGWDMMSGSIQGMMNLQWNWSMTDSLVRPGFWQVPYPGSGVTQYPWMGAFSDYLNPELALVQRKWDNMNSSNSMCPSLLDLAGNSNNNWMNQYNPFYLRTPGNNDGSSSSSRTKDKDGTSVREKNAQKKYNKLLGLMKQINAYTQSSAGSRAFTLDLREELERLVKGSEKKTYSEKYNELKALYDELSKDYKDDLKTFITKNSDQWDVGGGKVLERLEASGYENSNGHVDELIGDFHKQLAEGIYKDDAYLIGYMPNPAEALNPDSEIGEYKVLDIISSFNSKYPDENLIDLLFDACERIGDDEKEKNVRDEFKYIIDALRHRATRIAAPALGDDDTTKLLEETADKLDKAYEEFSDQNEIKELFNNLYVMTRIASIKALESDLQAQYGDFDEDLFKTDSFLLEDTRKDLKQEGLEDCYQSIVGKVKAKSVKGGKKVDQNIDNWSISNKVKELKEKGFLEETDEIVELDEDWDSDELSEEDKEFGKIIYKEPVKTGDRDYERYFIINADGTFTEVAKGDDGAFYPVAGEDSIKASAIAKAVKEAKEKQNPPKGSGSEDTETEEKEETTKTSTTKSKSLNALDIHKMLKWRTDDYKYATVNKALAKLNENNIMDFFESYYRETGFKDDYAPFGNEGFLEQMDDEHDDDKQGKSAITMANKKKMVNAMLKKAEKMGLKETDAYMQIEHIMKQYKSDEQDFNYNKGKNGGFWKRLLNQGLPSAGAGAIVGAIALSETGPGAIVGAVVGAVVGVVWAACERRNDNEAIDVNMKKLYDAIRAKEAEIEAQKQAEKPEEEKATVAK